MTWSVALLLASVALFHAAMAKPTANDLVKSLADGLEVDAVNEVLSRRSPRAQPATFNTVKVLSERRQAEVLKNMGNGIPPLGSVSWKPGKTCTEISDEWGSLPNGLYYIWYKKGTRVQVLRVYCEMHRDGGAWTFIPREAVIRGSTNRDLLKQVFTEKDKILLAINQQGRNFPQRFTLIRQLAQFGHLNMEVYINQHGTAPRPRNVDMGPYMYIQVLPPAEAIKKTTLGFDVNSKQTTYSNCYGVANNYWALYPNDQSKPVATGINQHCNQHPCINWLTYAVPAVGPQEIPNEFFFYTEMHFGKNGCGIEMANPGLYTDFSVAIGFR